MCVPHGLRGPWKLVAIAAGMTWLMSAATATGITGAGGGSDSLCFKGNKRCNDAFSDTKLGCCTLADGEDAVCCQVPQDRNPYTGASNTLRNFCCPANSKCTPDGCSPVQHSYPCGPIQGVNCTESYVCPPGPLDWDPTAKPHNVVVIGDSVSIGWTPQLATKLESLWTVTHSPASGDGGARSTSNGLQCGRYFTATATLKPLPLSSKDWILFNYGLHDYNDGFAGVDRYVKELQALTYEYTQLGPQIAFVSTTPAHNVNSAQSKGDDTNQVIQALNAKAAQIMAAHQIPYIDTYTPIMEKCGPVPFNDTGAHACPLCSPHCAQLAVHYTITGYEFIANIIGTWLSTMG